MRLLLPNRQTRRETEPKIEAIVIGVVHVQIPILFYLSAEILSGWAIFKKVWRMYAEENHE